MGDMIVNLEKLPIAPLVEGNIKIKRALIIDKKKIMDFIEENFTLSWIYEAEKAILQSPSKCFIATIEGELVGFACFDATAKGFFGPIGVANEYQNKGIGKQLLLRTLSSMKEFGYGYAIIGWVNEAKEFYETTVNAKMIDGGEPKNSVYANMISMK